MPNHVVTKKKKKETLMTTIYFSFKKITSEISFVIFQQWKVIMVNSYYNFCELSSVYFLAKMDENQLFIILIRLD